MVYYVNNRSVPNSGVTAIDKFVRDFFDILSGTTAFKYSCNILPNLNGSGELNILFFLAISNAISTASSKSMLHFNKKPTIDPALAPNMCVLSIWQVSLIYFAAPSCQKI